MEAQAGEAPKQKAPKEKPSGSVGWELHKNRRVRLVCSCFIPGT